MSNYLSGLKKVVNSLLYMYKQEEVEQIRELSQVMSHSSTSICPAKENQEEQNPFEYGIVLVIVSLFIIIGMGLLN